MKASARNQLFGNITNIVVGTINATVSIQTHGGNNIAATVTKESAEQLGIKVGLLAVVLIKAPQIMIITDFGGYRLSARNQFQGTVKAIHKGAVNSEIAIEVTGGDTFVSTITNESVNNLELAVGAIATVAFKAGSVILGVAA